MKFPSRHFLILFALGIVLLFSGPVTFAIDDDQDGMSDVWQRQYGITSAQANLDLDGTGLTNIQKSIAGLDPFDPNLRFGLTLTPLVPNQVRLTWQGVAFKRYRVQTSTDLHNWTDFIPDFPESPDGSFVGRGGTITTSDFLNGPKNFYRVQILPSFDSDGDGLDDYEEGLLGTNPFSADTDGDQLNDITEFQGVLLSGGQRVFTDPQLADSDGDGVADGAEVAAGRNPMDASDGFPVTPQQRQIKIRMQFRGTWPDYTSGPPPIPALNLQVGSVASIDQSIVNTATASPNSFYFGNTNTSTDRPINRGIEYPFTLAFAGNPPFWPTVVGRIWGSPTNPANEKANLLIFSPGKGYYITNDSGGIWLESEFSPTGNSSITSIIEQQLEARNFNTARLWAVTWDLDVDSLEAKGSSLPDRSLAEEDAEETQAKRIPVNLNDDNGNGVPDYLDAQVAGEKNLIPIILEASPQSLEWEKIKVKFNSDATSSELLLWRMNKASDAKDSGTNAVQPGTIYTAAQLGLGQASGGGANRTQLKLFAEGISVSSGPRYLEAVFIFNDHEYFKDRVLLQTVPDVDIEPDANQAGTTGDLVPSSRGPSGEKHFVSPKATGGAVIVKARLEPAATTFTDQYYWDGGSAVPGDPAARQAARDATGKTVVRVRRLSDNSIADQINVWVVWCTGTITQPPATSFDRTFSVRMIDGMVSPGAARFKMDTPITMIFGVQPISILDPAADTPNLMGPQSASVAVPGEPGFSPSPPGNVPLKGGVNSKWDSSRRYRYDVINPSLIPRGKFGSGLEALITSDPPNGTQEPFPADSLIGNDDPQVRDEDSNPYLASSRPSLTHAIGQISSLDVVKHVVPEAGASEGSVVEVNFYAQEFVRLEIASRWYLVSDPLPWKMLLKARFQSGQFIDTGSVYSPGN